MRKLVIITAATLSIGTAALAQDSTGVNSTDRATRMPTTTEPVGTNPTTPSQPNDVTTPAPPPPTLPHNNYRVEEMDAVDLNSLPASLQETLRDPAYQGWENSKIYQDRTTGDYIMQMQNAPTVPPTGAPTSPAPPVQTAPKTYRFDKAGKAVNINPFDDN